jgi:hypothetical protein
MRIADITVPSSIQNRQIEQTDSFETPVCDPLFDPRYGPTARLVV